MTTSYLLFSLKKGILGWEHERPRSASKCHQRNPSRELFRSRRGNRGCDANQGQMPPRNTPKQEGALDGSTRKYPPQRPWFELQILRIERIWRIDRSWRQPSALPITWLEHRSMFPLHVDGTHLAPGGSIPEDPLNPSNPFQHPSSSVQVWRAELSNETNQSRTMIRRSAP